MSANSTAKVLPVTPTIGARILDLDLSTAVGPEDVAFIRAALLRHRVLFFEDQHLTPLQHQAFAKQFGKLHVHPVYPHIEEVPEVAILDNHVGNPTDNDNWHTDVTFIETPPMASILCARELPLSGGDTLWSDMRAAYLALSARMKEFLDGLEAVHDFLRSFPPDIAPSRNAGPARYVKAREDHPPVVHPVIRTHPETGENGIFVNNGFTTRILGLPAGESEKVLEFLHQHIQRPEFTVRYRWKPNAVAFWDNRVTQHYAVNDYLPHRRVMHRATVLGDRPVFRRQESSVSTKRAGLAA